ncbi:MAG: MEDS domain-containing protein, partial [Propionibacteriaceae bacterium]|nr:MEDS domain-containing protein [Propionibacteriaceae bacterium]
MTQPLTTKANRTYRHEALLWRDLDEFLAGTVPFIQGGLDAGEPVMVAVINARKESLLDALGPDADDVLFVDMAELGRNPARIIPAWRQFLDDHSANGEPVRGIGEPIWFGRRPEEIIEGQLHEALLNVAVEPDTPFWLMCPYDVGQLDASVIEEAYRSHPAIVYVEQYRGSTLYGGRNHVDTVFGSELPPLSGTSIDRYFGPDDLRGISSFVAIRSYAAGMRADKAADLAVAVQELASSSIHRGASGGVIRLWAR